MLNGAVNVELGNGTTPMIVCTFLLMLIMYCTHIGTTVHLQNGHHKEAKLVREDHEKKATLQREVDRERARSQREADEKNTDRLIASFKETSKLEREANQRTIVALVESTKSASDALVSAVQHAQAAVDMQTVAMRGVMAELVALNAKVSKITSPLATKTNTHANTAANILPATNSITRRMTF